MIGGGGVHCDDGELQVRSCNIIANVASQGGGGVRCQDSTAVIEHCTIAGNAADDGAGIHTFSSVVTIEACSVSANTARYYGGAVYFERNSWAALGDSMIVDNSATAYGGGGLCVWGSHAEVTRCTIAGN